MPTSLARSSERKREVVGKGFGPSGRFRDDGSVNVHTKKMKPGISMAGVKYTDLGRSQERRKKKWA